MLGLINQGLQKFIGESRSLARYTRGRSRYPLQNGRFPNFEKLNDGKGSKNLLTIGIFFAQVQVKINKRWRRQND